MPLARIDAAGLLDHVFSSLEQGRGGWIVTANLDILRRYTRDPSARALYRGADLRVADGMPLVWASRISGDALPERVAGSSLVWQLAERAARDGRSVYLLGGTSGTAAAAARELQRRFPGLAVSGTSEPWVTLPPTGPELEALAAPVLQAAPDIVLVGLGSPKQELVIRYLREQLSSAWMIGVGITFSFVAGEVARAPEWLQRRGLEWAHRLVQEPRRLSRRYLVEDAPFAVRVLAQALATRLLRGWVGPAFRRTTSDTNRPEGPE